MHVVFRCSRIHRSSYLVSLCLQCLVFAEPTCSCSLGARCTTIIIPRFVAIATVAHSTANTNIV
ncbi:hypothetical protein PF010_g16780 [Phytophthora fragariae]|uniref:Secreted protein n=2 Tax=Phytophthora TaxID=4783 RepID=A0A6A3JQ33_9STRA|nr:hypothetical protein PF011_g16273 [Phytophthora fragariae]KAE9009551.1 hypothetical protein PR002_g15585 [Phytophthora rubi]KAE9015708.1 hypothetical protein PR001_g14834 [Phytophthora rubi]KAE9095241.1 hypothetical protein PF010_g16780 [Phytophthora fragariae]KAE9210812.1 hypothetical protein PF004_g16093 [Phytophthora fragariae]